MAEHIKFNMHPALLWDVINRQSGTISKAILEGVQNSVDAGATKCDLTIDRQSFSIVDDGKGFEKEDIYMFFRTFGQPHEEGDSKFGRYRMGRGQIMSFGVNRWLTNGNRMDVDLRPQKSKIATEALGFEYTALPTPVPGCDIAVALYDKLSPSDVDSLVLEIAKYVAWAPIPVTLNGKRINKDPTAPGEPWDHVTDDAYIRLRDKGSLAVYNMGVLVSEMPNYRFGTGGVIISRVPLDVTFARNEIVSTCKVWKRIQAKVRTSKVQEIEQKPKVTEAEREGALADLAVGRGDIATVKNHALFELASGAKITLKSLIQRLKACNHVAVAPLKDRAACRAIDDKIAVVFSEDMLQSMEVDTPQELLAKLYRSAQASAERYSISSYALDPAQRSFLTEAELKALVPDNMVEVPKSKLSKIEKLQAEVLQTGMWEVMRVFTAASSLAESPNTYYDERLERAGIKGDLRERLIEHVRDAGRSREIRIGSSTMASAWTDGKHTIWFDRDKLALVSDGTSGCHRLATLGLHEMLTDSPDTDTHVHDAAFYELLHDLAATSIIGDAVEKMIDKACNLIRKEQKRPTGVLKKAEDNLALMRDYGMARPAVAEEEEAPALAM